MVTDWAKVVVTHDGETNMLRDEPFWIDDDLYLPLADGTNLVLRNAYMSGLRYEGLDYGNGETTLVGNNKEWDREPPTAD